MRPVLAAALALVVAAAATLAGALSASRPAAAAPSTLRIAIPLVRASEAPGTGRGAVTALRKGSRHTFTVSVALLPGDVAPPLGVFLEDGPGADTYTQVASIDALKRGTGSVRLFDSEETPAALDVPDFANLVGRRVEVRGGAGHALLRALLPAGGKFQGTKLAADVAATQGSPAPNAAGRLTTAFSSKKAIERVTLRMRGLDATRTYGLWVEDAASSGTFSYSGDLVRSAFVRDTGRGDPLPLGADRVASLDGRRFQVRESDVPVAEGAFGTSGGGGGGGGNLTFPLLAVVVYDVPGSTVDKYLRSVSTSGPIYRSNYYTLDVSLQDLIDTGEAQWRFDFVRNVPGGVVCNVRLQDNDQVWWSVGRSGSVSGMPERYLGIHYGSSPPVVPGDVEFVLRRKADVGGKPSVTIESVVAPGMYLSNTGHTLTANGVQLVSTTSPIEFVLQ